MANQREVLPDTENALAIGAKIKMSLSSLNPTERSIVEWLITKGNITKIPDCVKLRGVLMFLNP